MNLREIIASIDGSQSHLCIVAKTPWVESAEARLVKLTPECRVPSERLDEGYEYFLEVSVALEEVIGGLEDVLTQEQRYKAVHFYAKNDAFPDWLSELRGNYRAPRC